MVPVARSLVASSLVAPAATARGRAGLSLVAVLLVACAQSLPAPPGAPVPIGTSRPEDRVIVGDFRTVRAIASSFDRVYVAYTTGIGIWSPLRDAWELPRAAPDRFALQRVRTAVVDPLDHALWLGGDDGLLHFDPLLDRWDRQPVPGTVVQLATDPADPTAIWARTSAGWLRVPRIGPPTASAPPASLRPAPTLEDAYRDLPALRSLGATLALGQGLVPGRLTAAAPAPDGSHWFVGTDTHGLLLVDRVGARVEPLPQGLPGETVGALAAVPGGVWVATDASLRGDILGGPGGAVGVTLLSESLDRTTWVTGNEVFGLGAEAIRRIVPGERVLWLATDRGVVRRSEAASQVVRWGEDDGLQDQRAFTATWWQDGLMVGTARGLARIDRLDEVSRPAPNLLDPVYAVHATRDTLWIGAARGLAMLVAGDSVARVPPRWPEQLAARREVLGVGYVADTLVAMTRDEVTWRDPVSGEWVPGAPIGATTGALRAFHATPDGIWVGGDRAAVLTSAGGAVLHVLRVGLDLPDAVTAITTTPQHLWIGTLQGVVRLTLRTR